MINRISSVSLLFSRSMVFYRSASCFSKLGAEFKQRKLAPNLCIEKSRMNEKLGGFLIFQSDQTKKLLFMSYAFLGFSAYLTGMIWLMPDPVYSIHQKISLGILLVGMGIYQLKLRSTLKRLILDYRGETVRMQFYNWLGFTSKSREIHIPDIKGIRKLHPYIPIPSFVYFIGPRKYVATFNSSGIKQHALFPTIMNGRCITVIK